MKVVHRLFLSSAWLMIASSALSCSSGHESIPAVASPAENADTNVGTWVNKAWWMRVPQGAHPIGAMYIFLSDGSLLMTSCRETYRLATWRPASRGRITIEEDAAVRYDAIVEEVNPRELHVRLILKDEELKYALEPAPVPYVCPDMPR
jgi:hypothetical protein